MLQNLFEYLHTQLTQNEFAIAGLFMTSFGAILYSLKVIPFWVYNFCKRKSMTTVILEERDIMYSELNKWLFENCQQQFKNMTVSILLPSDSNSEPKISYRQHNDSFVFWYDGYPIFLSKTIEKLEGARDIWSTHSGKFALTTVFNSKILFKFMNDLLLNYNLNRIQKHELEILTYSTRQGCWDISDSYIPIKWDDIITSGDDKERIMKEVKNRQKHKEFLKSKGIKNNFGISLDGLPGNGKSSLAAALAYELHMLIYYLDINAMKDINDLKDAFSKIQKDSVILIEDIDRVYKGRDPVNPDCKIPFSTFINYLSGTLEKDNVILIMTTNKIEELDDALIRDGRIDLRCTVMPPNKESTIKYIEKFYTISLPQDTYIKIIPNSFAKLANICKENIEDFNNTLKVLQV